MFALYIERLLETSIINKERCRAERDKKPSVCVVCDPVFPEISGSSIQALEQANYLIEHGVNVFFLAPTFNKKNVNKKYVKYIDIMEYIEEMYR